MDPCGPHVPAVHRPAGFLLSASILDPMRKPGRVLYSDKAVRATTSPSSLSAARRAAIRYRIRKCTTSAIDDMAFIHANAKDATTRRHMEQEVERLAMAVRSAGGPPHRLADAGQDARQVARKAPPGGEPFHIQIEREVGRIAAPTTAGTGSPEPVPDPASGAPNGPDSGRHAGTGRLPSVWERLARWSRSNLLPFRRQDRSGSG